MKLSLIALAVMHVCGGYTRPSYTFSLPMYVYAGGPFRFQRGPKKWVGSK